MTQAEIEAILSLVERSAFDSIEISMGQTRIFASKTADLRAAPTMTEPSSARATVAEDISKEPKQPVSPSSRDGETPPTGSPLTEGPPAGTKSVKAPVVGTFYVAPEPGARPFVELGQSVAEDTTVGLIEVMKTFIDVKAGCVGTIVRCRVENGMSVEFDQPLFEVEPAEA
ncbi:acetyl-CoA carboxylase biotin carboxyl carrier protein [Tranquillimonas alkanivorans]|nr:biotin/lipoyl-containing protein [Tranquillimonas alkanivorans]